MTWRPVARSASVLLPDSSMDEHGAIVEAVVAAMSL